MAGRYLEDVIALRADALRELRESPAFDAFVALDAAAVSLGAERATLDGRAFQANSLGAVLVERARNRSELQKEILSGKPPKPLSQGDAAEIVLRTTDMPLRLGDLLAGVEEQGLVLTGDKVANFRSNISRDRRFYSLKFDGQYLWWFAGVELPKAWVEATGYDLVIEPVASLPFSNQEGGGPVATTDNTSVT
ncbi:hypothetical protein GCM10011529_18760 [Polymorphobacter glacialis]|uniref:Uncharacterized protein n=1 Tax=Sandarakinorhabdus glacialis TaxID=1614636 RepID=A0A916ZT47_9SPHN|nr:hypothetical protein [Polymorphobacter glacialis]GGE12621.1 hypothetical protein GCM10011529_18760 [Polymorphobacter glacialis]